ncbi:cyclic nucleotide-binding domain-containing protein [bacterium]|nr:cyclic nucleotide-binding domain-containing protein [bacterium]
MERDRRDLLEKCLLFDKLSSAEIEAVLEITSVVDYKRGDVIFQKDEVGEALYLILEGSVRVSVILDSIGEEVIAILREGAHLGEMALIDRGPRSATAIAHEDSKLVRLDKDRFDELLHQDQMIELKILRNMVRAFTSRIRDTDQSLTFLRFTLRKE